MNFTLAFAAIILASLVAAQSNPFNVPIDGYLMHAGEPTQLTWKPTTGGTVTLMLRNGASGALNPGTTITANIPNNGAYAFTPPSSIVEDNSYTIEIIDDSDPSQTNYTPQFDILSPVKAVPSSASASASASALASSVSSTSGSAATTMSTITTAASGTSSSAIESTTSGSPAAASTSGSSTTGGRTNSTSKSVSSSAATSTITQGNGAAELKVQGGLLGIAAGLYVVL